MEKKMLTIDGIISKFYINSYDNNIIELSENNIHNKEKVILKHKITATCYVSFEQLSTDFSVKKFDNLNFDDLLKLKDIEILLIGTGEYQKFPQKSLFTQLKNLDYSVDFMTTSAACRTFNILANESRKVGAILFV
jgi:uncharacterized protein